MPTSTGNIAVRTMSPPQVQRELTLGITLSLGYLLVLFNAGAYLPMVPTIAGSLGRNVAYGVWTQDLYFLTMGLALPLVPWLRSHWGSRRMLLLGFALFALSAAVDACTRQYLPFLLARMVAGLAGGWCIPLLAGAWPRGGTQMQPRVHLWWAWAATTPFALGPFVGGWLADNWGWVWLFRLDIAISALVLIGLALWQEEDGQRRAQDFDWLGYGFLCAALVLFEMLLNLGGIVDWWRSVLIRVLALAGISGLIAAALWLWPHPRPALQVRLLRRRAFLFAALGIWLSALLFQGGMAMLVVQYQVSFGYSARIIGEQVLPMALLAPFSVWLTYHWLQHRHPIWLLIFSLLVLAVAAFWMASFALPVSPEALFGPLLLTGIAVGSVFTAWTQLGARALAADEKAAGLALLNLLRNLGLAMGIPIIIGLWERRWALQRHFLVEDRGATLQVWQHSLQYLAEKISLPGAEQTLANNIHLQATMLAFNETFWVLGWGFLLLAGCCLLAFVGRWLLHT